MYSFIKKRISPLISSDFLKCSLWNVKKKLNRQGWKPLITRGGGRGPCFALVKGLSLPQEIEVGRRSHPAKPGVILSVKTKLIDLFQYQTITFIVWIGRSRPYLLVNHILGFFFVENFVNI